LKKQKKSKFTIETHANSSSALQELQWQVQLKHFFVVFLFLHNYLFFLKRVAWDAGSFNDHYFEKEANSSIVCGDSLRASSRVKVFEYISVTFG
jgi:hypothetical protein